MNPFPSTSDVRKYLAARIDRSASLFFPMNQPIPPATHSIETEREFVRSFTAMANLAHANSRAKGFWDLIESLKSHPRFAEIEVFWKLSRHDLIISETAEATEGVRKNLPDDHLPHRSMEVAELADTVIRIFDYAGGYNLPVAEVILEKMAYNTGRQHMHGKLA